MVAKSRLAQDKDAQIGAFGRANFLPESFGADFLRADAPTDKHGIFHQDQ